MRILWMGGVFALFLGVFFGFRASGEDSLSRQIAVPVEIPKARVVPGHPFYALKAFGRDVRERLSFGSVSRARAHARSLEERLGELTTLLEAGAIPELLATARRAYGEELQVIEESFGDGGRRVERFVEDFIPRVFFHSQVLAELGEGALRNELFVTAGQAVERAGARIALDVRSLEERLLPAVGFFDELARLTDAGEVKVWALSLQQELAARLRGYYLSGEVRPGAILGFFSDGIDSFLQLRILDVLRDTFSGDELGNQLEFIRQKGLLRSGDSLAVWEEVAREEAGRLERTLDFSQFFSEEAQEETQGKFTDAEFTYDRAFDFASTGLFGRALTQISLSWSSTHSFLLDTLPTHSEAQYSVHSLRNSFEFLKGIIQEKEEELEPRISGFFQEAERRITELVVLVGQNSIPDSNLLTRARSFVVALQELVR